MMKKFVVRGTVAKTPDRLRHINKGDTVWLGWTPEGGGWHQWEADAACAKPFDDARAAMREAQGCKGPWYYAPDQTSLEVIEVDYTPPEVRPAKMLTLDGKALT